MPNSLREFMTEIDDLRSTIRRIKSKQLSSAKERLKLQHVVDTYFADIRPAIARNDQQSIVLRPIDTLFQELLQISHTRALVTKYARVLKQLRESLVQLDAGVTSQNYQPPAPSISDVDQKIISTLEALVSSAALSYQQAINDLQCESRLSWRGPATDLRESLRETLDHLAPDEEVKRTEGFKLEPNTTGPTMKQKVRYILKKRGVSRSMAATPEEAVDSVEIAVGSFVRSVYTRSSVSTHTPTNKSEVLRIRDWVRVTLCELLAISA